MFLSDVTADSELVRDRDQTWRKKAFDSAFPGAVCSCGNIFRRNVVLAAVCGFYEGGEAKVDSRKSSGKGKGAATMSHLEKTYRPGNANYRIQKVYEVPLYYLIAFFHFTPSGSCPGRFRQR